MSGDDLERAAELVADSDHLVTFTGAGVSTESGIPDFRSPGGIWDRYDPDDFTIEALTRDPVAYWETRLEMERDDAFDWDGVEPNPAHEAIARLEREGPLEAVITQNVDGLHQAAGNDDDAVLELHGSRDRAKCYDCGARYPLERLESQLERQSIPPRCHDCGGLLKYATVSFGESLPRDVLTRARRQAVTCDCFVVVGSSVTVEPAATMPRLAAQHGASLVVVNLDETPVDGLAEAVVHGKAGESLPRIVEEALE